MVSQPVENYQKLGGIFHDIETTQVHTYWPKNTLDTLSFSLQPLVHSLVIPTMVINSYRVYAYSSIHIVVQESILFTNEQIEL